jgi:hypothetical protein
MSLFLPITKVDLAQRLVYGTISEEVPDKAGEILDYASARPAFEEWSRQFHEASNGKSLGNVRAMHGAIAAGKLTDIRFDDSGKRIDGVAKIVDDDEWRKVTEGVYTGFSIGGGYARRWPDAENPHLMRYTPVLTEISLVDNPAVPTATFQVIKVDGSVEMRKFMPGQDEGEGEYEDEYEYEDNPPGAAEDAPCAARMLEDLAWLAAHAEAIGAAGLLAHIRALQGYLEETDEGDDMGAEPAEKSLGIQIEALQKRILHLEAQPLPAKGILRAVGKNDERARAEDALASLSPAERAKELMKIALANPMAM